MESLWLVTVFMETDVPEVLRYVPVKRMKNGWKVKYCGGEILIRDALERHFFDDEYIMKKFVRQHLERKASIHQSRIEELQAALKDGVPVRNKPAERPGMQV